MSATPILDLEQEPPRKPWWLLFGLTLFSLAFIFAPFLAEWADLNPSFNGLLWLPAIYVAIAVHEAGHLIEASWRASNPEASR